MGHKRKHQPEDGAQPEPPQKVQVVDKEQTLGLTAAQKRQQRSERKAKKPVKPTRAEEEKRKKKKISQKAAESEVRGTSDVEEHNAASGTTSKKEKIARTAKEKKQSPRAARKESRKDTEASQPVEEAKQGVSQSTNTNTRFICFVGNLPYTATVQQIQEHFKKIEPKVRLSTDKNTGKSKGFAFLEFDSYDKMNTCLKTYHHTIFDPDKTQDEENKSWSRSNTARKINVELTAGGGGGKSGQRKEKIREKNQKLEEERTRSREAAAKREAKANGGVRPPKEEPKDTRGDIHPSRMARVKE